ncbi:NUDIX domain-containing protein [Paracoccus suum]|nr:NUDIX hydrolase [Paracoccus suum]
MGMRGAKAAFMASKYVFPGGAVDPEDFARASTNSGPLAIDSDCPADAILTCARRELAEETGLKLSSNSRLHFFFRAVTPPGRPRRFDARFLLADARDLTADPDDFSAACDELSHLHWVRLDEAPRLDLPFITEVVLAQVASLIPMAGADALVQPSSVPFFDNRDAEPRFTWIGG